MRSLLLLVLGVGPLVFAGALGRLVQPDGSSVVLGEASDPGTRTLLFPAQSIPQASWITLPGSVLDQAVAVTAKGRTVLDFPSVTVPGLRYAIEVPAGLLALTLRGHLETSPVLVRTLDRPDTPGQPWVVRTPRFLAIDLPAWKTAPGYTPLVTLTATGQVPWKVEIVSGEAHRVFSLPGTVRTWDYAPQAWDLPPRRIEVTGAGLTSARVRALGPSADLPADPPTLLTWPPLAWRSPTHEWFAWSGTSVLVLVSRDYRVQDAYLKRLAFFVEKKGFRGKLWSDEETSALHGWNAHDYSAPDLARFFTTAAAQSFALHPEEVELRGRLTAAGVLTDRGHGVWEPGTGALVGISAESPPALRAALFTHEAFHGLYYTSTEFRSGVAAVWQGLSTGAQEAFRSYLAVSDYDPTFEALMVNEFQAYVLQRSAAEWPVFFRDRVIGGSRVFSRSRTSPALVNEYLAAAKALDSLVFSLYGLRSGDVTTVAVR
jgi:hypothetical protein